MTYYLKDKIYPKSGRRKELYNQGRKMGVVEKKTYPISGTKTVVRDNQGKISGTIEHKIYPISGWTRVFRNRYGKVVDQVKNW